jgi:hypothetical protein
MDQPKSSRREIVGLDRGAVESSARPFDAIGELGVDHCERAAFEGLQARVISELTRDIFLGQVSDATSVYEAKPATITLAELQRTVLICEEIARRSPFQWCQFMPKDAPHLIRCEGKYYFGLHRWREFSDALIHSQSSAMALLLSWKIIDLDAAMAEHKRKWK